MARRLNPLPGEGIVYALTGISSGKPNFKILQFFNNTDGNSPQAPPIPDAAGNLYGTTFWGGNLNDCANGCGVVFEIRGSGSLWARRNRAGESFHLRNIVSLSSEFPPKRSSNGEPLVAIVSLLSALVFSIKVHNE